MDYGVILNLLIVTVGSPVCDVTVSPVSLRMAVRYGMFTICYVPRLLNRTVLTYRTLVQFLKGTVPTYSTITVPTLGENGSELRAIVRKEHLGGTKRFKKLFEQRKMRSRPCYRTDRHLICNPGTLRYEKRQLRQ